MIRIPVAAESDDDAINAAYEQAGSLRHPDGAVAGHLEVVGETRDDLMEIVRVVQADAMFLRNLPPDWKP